MAKNDYRSEYMGLAASATANPGSAPQYGLVYDLATGQWQDAAHFRQFVRSVLPVTQQRAKQQAAVINRSTEADRELQIARNLEEHGLLMTDDQFPNRDDGDSSLFQRAGNELLTGWNVLKGAANTVAHDWASKPVRAIPILGSYLGGESDDEEADDGLYERYTAKGGLLTEEQFNSFSKGTQSALYKRVKGNENLREIAATPGVAQGLMGLDYAYRGLTTVAEMGQAIPSPADLLPGGSGPGDPAAMFSQERWARAWRESQKQSLGNALVDNALDSFASREQLDRWKRDNSWYQLTSMGTEFLATWYADPAVIGGKALGGAARFTRGEMPLNATLEKGVRQNLQRERITVRNPITRQVVNLHAGRIEHGQQAVRDYALAVPASEFANLPMFKSRYRAVDGGASAYALHWAVNNSEAANKVLNSSGVRDELAKTATEKGFSLPETLDIEDLTWRSMFSDPKAWAMLDKLQQVAPEELSRIAPGSQTLLDSVRALRTKADTLQNEVDDLIAQADAMGTDVSRFHRWEVDTDLAVRQRQLQQATKTLHKYNGYQDWLDLVSGAKSSGVRPEVARVQGPSRSRWSEVRTGKADQQGERRHLFMDSFYGAAHSYNKVSKALFLKRANTAELHSLDSGMMSINRQFDQFEHFFDYAPEGVRGEYVDRFVGAETMFDRYKVMHDLEETHLISAVAGKFGIQQDTARAIVNKIYDERNRTINGILSGDNSIYRTAPTLAQRLGGPDSTVDLVSRDAESGTVTLSVMHGSHKQTYEVPESALAARVRPEDVTQTPNYYNPLDTRRLYYELKHDKTMLEELDAGVVRRGQAAVADVVEWAGTRFNALWKPAQLFRLGWPIRVLMDEGMRAMAVLGPMYWLTGEGAEAVAKSTHNAMPNVTEWAVRHSKGPLGTDISNPRPRTRVYPATDVASTPDQFARDLSVNKSVLVPEILWPKINPDRAATIDEHVRAYDDYRSLQNAAAAWSKPDGQTRLLTQTEPLTPAQTRALAHSRDLRHQAGTAKGPEHPIDKVSSEWHARSNAGTANTPPSVYDAATGRRAQRGYVIPIPDAGAYIGSTDKYAWYSQNAEMLSRSGMRLVVTPDGSLTLGRHFRSNEFTKARQFAEYVSDVHPDVRMWDLQSGKWHVVEDANKLSPTAEQTYRQFASEEIVERTEGKAPIEGEPEVYHGTDQRLPENLSPRDDVEVVNGRMLGSGLYTTMSRQTAESYGAAHLYTIKGSKSGKTYKVFDLDREIRPSDASDFESWHREKGLREDSVYHMIVHTLRSRNPYRDYLSTRTDHAERATWANVHEMLGGDANDLLNQYLMSRHGAGALTHLGGTTHGHPHQVYVWLHPEDLVVKPLYAGTGNYMPLEQWFGHPQSVENVVPENRIIRKGTRNPMLRELRTIAQQIKNGDSPVTNELWDREDALMDALGLGRRRNAPHAQSKTNPLLPERYYIKDEDHFNKMVDEARSEGEASALRAAANGDLRAQEQAVLFPDVDWVGDFDAAIDDPASMLLNRMRQRQEQGEKWKAVRSSDGQVTYVPGAYSGHSGQLFRGLTSSNGAIDVLSEGHGSATSLFRRKAEGHRAYAPPSFSDKAVKDVRSAEHKKAVRYFQVYADTINDHIGNSPIMQRLMKGWNDDDLIQWLDETPEGQRIRNEIKPEEIPTGVWVDEQRYKLNYYVPSRKLQRLLAKGRLKPSDFRKSIADEDLPTIYGPDLEVLDRRRNTGEFIKDVADKLWSGLGTKPIDAFSRHPFAQAVYNRRLESLVAATDSKWLTPEMIEQFERQARSHAMNEVRKRLYHLADQTNFTDMVRFIAPFWGAQYEAITKWLRIISDRPETVARFFGGQRAVYNNFVVIDEDGNPVQSGVRDGGMHNLGLYHPDDRVVMSLPSFIRKRFPGMDTIGSVGIPVGSANTVLQGEMPLLPGFGPLVTIPADQFLRKVSDTYGVEHDENFVYRWLFPVGRPRSQSAAYQVMEQLFPSWGKRALQAGGPESDMARINMEMLVGREMILKARESGKPEPTAEDIKKAADHLWGTRLVSSIVQPFQVQYLPEHQYWIDAAHRYQREYGAEWWDRFIDDYSEEAAIFATSSSNSIGVPATAKGMEEWSANKKLIQKYPEWTTAIISPQAYMADFSSDAYGQQFNITLGPGDTRTLRSTSSLQERLYGDPESRLGWREYRKLSAAIEAELYARGMSNIQSRGAEDLQQLKRAAVADLSQKYKSWGRDYRTRSDTIYDDVENLKEFAFLPAFDKRPDMQGVRQYLALRQQVTDRLDAYGQQGGSRSLQAQENGALRDWFYDQVGQLVLSNPSFAEFYTRFLDADDMTQGGGGF